MLGGLVGAACLHGKVRLGSGHLGLIRVAVHGDKVGGHAVEVVVGVLTTSDFSLGSFTRSRKRAGHVGIHGGLMCSGGVATWLNGAVRLSRAL